MIRLLAQRVLLCFSCLLAAAPVVAGDMYKWQDENGTWHFSSTPPETEQAFKVIEMPADPTPVVSMRKLGLESYGDYFDRVERDPSGSELVELLEPYTN